MTVRSLSLPTDALLLPKGQLSGHVTSMAIQMRNGPESDDGLGLAT